MTEQKETARVAPYTTEVSEEDQAMVERMIDFAGEATAQYGETKMDITQKEDVGGHTPDFKTRFGLGA